jgi:hypothetical protein
MGVRLANKSSLRGLREPAISLLLPSKVLSALHVGVSAAPSPNTFRGISVSNIYQRLVTETIVILTLASIVLLSGCFENIHGDNSEQKRRSHVLLTTLVQQSTVIGVEEYSFIVALPSFHQLCAVAQPKIQHENCLNLAIEGGSSIVAESRARTVVEEIIRLRVLGAIDGLKGAYVVVTPVHRIDDFRGEVTPNSLPNHFAIGASKIMLIKD